MSSGAYEREEGGLALRVFPNYFGDVSGLDLYFAITSAALSGGYLLGGVMLLFLGRKTNSSGNLFLAALLALLGIFYIGQVLEYVFDDQLPALGHLVSWLCYPVFPAALHLSVANYVTPGRELQKDDLWWLFLPAGSLVAFWMASEGLVVSMPRWRSITDGLSISFVHDGLIFLVATATWWGAFRSVRQHAASIRQLRADADEVDLKWLRNIVYTLPALLLIWANGFVPFMTPLDYSAELIQFGLLAYLMVQALSQQEVFPYRAQRLSEVRQVIEEASDTVQVPSPDTAALAELAARLDQLMASDKPYLSTSLGLLELARLLAVRPQSLSHVLQAVFGENFYAYVNRHRAMYAQDLLVDSAHAHYTVAAIGKLAGFNSRTTFYKAFKAATGITPTAYQAQHSTKATEE